MIKVMFVGCKEVEMYVYAVFFQRKTGAGIRKIQDIQFWFLTFYQMLVHEKGFRIFVNDNVQAVSGQIFQMIMHKKPGIDISLRNHL